MNEEMNPVDCQDPRADFTVVVIAAGRGRRFGSDKRRSPLGEEKTLLQRTLACYAPNFPRIFVALSARADDDELARHLHGAGVQVLRSENADQGMGCTIADVVPFCKKTSKTLIALGDMPFISPDVLDRLVANSTERHIVYPSFRGRRGHPVIFGSAFYPDLGELRGDRGASSLIQANAEMCREIPVEDIGVLFDIDTPDDLQRALSMLQAFHSGGAST